MLQREGQIKGLAHCWRTLKTLHDTPGVVRELRTGKICRQIHRELDAPRKLAAVLAAPAMGRSPSLAYSEQLERK